MSYGTEDILRQLRAGEDSAWEFKQIVFTGHRPIRPSRDDWADEIAAFANARGGVLLCGATDDGEAQGMSQEQIVALDALLVEVSTDSIKPAVRIHTWHTWPGTCGSRPARSRPAWTCRNTATARCSRRWSTRWRIATIRCAAAVAGVSAVGVAVTGVAALVVAVGMAVTVEGRQ